MKQYNRQTGQSIDVERPILKNAYILVYERKNRDYQYNDNTSIHEQPESKREAAEKAPVEAENSETDKQKTSSNSSMSHSGSESSEGNSLGSPLTREKYEASSTIGTSDSKKKNRKKSKKKSEKKLEKKEKKWEMAAKVPVPEEIMKKIWQENRDFIAEKRLYDVNFFTFIWKLINLYTSDKYIAQNHANHSQSSMLAIELACKFLIDIYARSKDNQMLPMWMNHMFFIFKSSSPACVWLLEHFYRKINAVKNVLMSCPIDRTRRAFADLIKQVLTTLRERECNSYSQQLEDVPLFSPFFLPLLLLSILTFLFLPPSLLPFFPE